MFREMCHINSGIQFLENSITIKFRPDNLFTRVSYDLKCQELYL